MSPARLCPRGPSTSRRYRSRPEPFHRILGLRLRLFCLLTTPCTLMNLLRKSLDTAPSAPMAACGHLILRASIGAMIFYIHGVHKLEGGVAYLQHGTPWTLAKEVAEMHFPAPVASAFAATALQFLCSPLLALGLFTRLNAALLTGTLSVAILDR